MDKFELMMQQIPKLSEEDQAKKIDDQKKLCICEGCPTYNECAGTKDELLYCVLGKSPNCIDKEVTCLCPDCPISEQLGLTKQFFCTRGSEKAQRET